MWMKPFQAVSMVLFNAVVLSSPSLGQWVCLESCGAFFWYVGVRCSGYGREGWGWGRRLSTRQECECFKWHVNLGILFCLFLFLSINKNNYKKKKLHWGPKWKKCLKQCSQDYIIAPATCLWVQGRTLLLLRCDVYKLLPCIQSDVISLQETRKSQILFSFSFFFVQNSGWKKKFLTTFVPIWIVLKMICRWLNCKLFMSKYWT